MSINNFQIDGDNYKKCKTVLELLNCNLLWVINANHNSLNILSTDQAILRHYLDKQYYLYDPNVNYKPYDNEKLDWQITLGTDCETFNKSGFLYDIYKMFNIEEFASIEQKIGSEIYCCRFFTRNNRFVFMNKLLSHMPLLKRFATNMTNIVKTDLDKQLKINIAS